MLHSKYLMTSTVIRCGALAMLSALLFGCSMPRLIPVQMARLPQLETYEHFFTIGDADNTSEEAQRRAVAEVDDVFTRMIGDKNWQAVKDLYGFGAVREELVQGEIYIRGSLAVMIYLDPLSHNSFLVEGQGRYFLIRKESGLIMLQGAFVINPAQHRIADLDKAELPLSIELITTRITGKPTYYYKGEEVVYKIKIDQRLKREKIYSIDYQENHEVFLRDKKIGYLKLDSFGNIPNEKLIDLRGRQFLKSDYETLMTRKE